MGWQSLATWIAEVEPQDLSPRAARGPYAERGPHRREHGFGALMAAALTLFALAIDGYHPSADDGGLYLAGVKRLLDPTLYPHTTAFVLEPMRLSLFAPTVAALVRLLPMSPAAMLHRGLPAVLLALHLASIWATLFAAWMLAIRCWTLRPARIGAVVLLACWLALPVAGTALQLMDPYATARSFSTPAMVLALVGALDMSTRGVPSTAKQRRNGLLLWAVGILLAAAMHPLMAAYALAATLMLFCARTPNRSMRLWATASLAATALGIAASLQSFAPPESAQYIRAALTRTYWFPAQWRWYELLGLAAPLAILALEAGREPAPSNPPRYENVDARRALARMAIAMGSTAWLVALLFAHATASTHLVARLQPLRAFHVVYFVLVLLLGARLGERVLQRSAVRWGAAMLLLGSTMLAAERAEFRHSNHIELPRVAPRNQWVQAFLWVRHNTPKDALFALDADYINAPGEDAQCFRAIAERSSLPDYSKDGGEASIAPQLALAWAAGEAAQQGLSAPSTTDTQRLAALRPLGVDWLLLQATASTQLDCPFANSAVKVCRLR